MNVFYGCLASLNISSDGRVLGRWWCEMWVMLLLVVVDSWVWCLLLNILMKVKFGVLWLMLVIRCSRVLFISVVLNSSVCGRFLW